MVSALRHPCYGHGIDRLFVAPSPVAQDRKWQVRLRVNQNGPRTGILRYYQGTAGTVGASQCVCLSFCLSVHLSAKACGTCFIQEIEATVSTFGVLTSHER